MQRFELLFDLFKYELVLFRLELGDGRILRRVPRDLVDVGRHFQELEHLERFVFCHPAIIEK